jgi:hypothetical protein
VEKRAWTIERRTLRVCEEEQITALMACGIPRTNARDIFDTRVKGDIYIHITLACE